MPRALTHTRLACVLAALLTIAAGLGVRRVLHGWTAKYGGDALWSCVVFACVVFVRPRITPARAALVALGISYAVEFAQITPGPAWLSSQSRLLALVFGAVFSPYDLLAYTAGVSLAWAAHTALSRAADQRPST